MNWKCAVCGGSSRTNRHRCRTCGGMRWRPAAKRDIRELEGPVKRIAPKGLLLARPGKQAPSQEPNGIECGVCHAVIYTATGGYDNEAFLAARMKHYSASPTCQAQKSKPSH